MKTKLFNLKSWLAMLFLFIGVSSAWGEEVTYDFSKIDKLSSWGTTYSKRIVNYSESTVTFESANKSTQTITNVPVTKGQFVTLVMNDGYTLNSAKFVCKQWGSKAQTITLHYSTDGGKNYTSTGTTSTNFTIESNSLPARTNAVKITFSSTSNQVGISSATINYSKAGDTSVETSVSIEAPSNFNTDLYTSESAGKLAATVSANGTSIDGATVTWSSLTPATATVDEEGNVTLVSEGQAQIKAIYAGVANQYKSSSATYSFTVVDNTPATVYVKVTDKNQIVKGNKYLLVNADGSKAMGAITITGTTYGTAIDVTSTDNKISIKNEAVNVLTLGASQYSDWIITTSIEKKNLSWSNGNSITTSTSSSDQTARWLLNLTDGVITIKSVKDNNRVIKYNSGSPRFACYTSGQQTLTLYVKEGSPINNKERATVSIDKTALTVGGETATITAVPAALVMSYASSDDTIASVANGVATGLGHGSATITVTWAEQTIDDVTYEAGSTTFDITVTDPNRPGTQNHPYTVAQALEFIETLNGESSEEVYVSGIVSQVDEYVSKYSSITYWISDDGTTESQLECYSGKGLNSADFSSVSDIQVGDIVTVAGTLKKYNDIYEFNYNNYLVSFERPTFEITAQANDNAMGSVSLEENVITATPAKGYRLANPAYTVKSGTATVTQDGNEFVVKAETDCTVQINFEAIPKHNVVWSVNGTETTTTALEDAAIEFPEEPADIEGKTFVGWATETIDGETDEAPTFVTSATMGTEDLKFYAVFAEGEVTETPANYTLDYSEESALSSSTKWGSYGTAYNYTASDGGTWVVKAYKSGGMQINSKKDASIKIPECSGNITTIEITGSAAKAVGLSAEDYTGSGTITYIAEGTDATSQTLDLSEQSVTTGYIVPKSGNIVITKIVVNYTGVIANYSAYCTTILPDIEVAAPIVFHDGGVYESALSVPMFAQEGATIKYTVNGGSEQTYLAPVAISETTTLRAWAEVKGVKSAEVVKTYTIEATEYEGSDFDGYYQIKNNGNDKFVNVAGRKTVTFVSEEAAKSAAGTVIKVKTSEGQVQTLRAQGIDLPGYVEKAMNYVPKIVQLVVDKLHATGAGTLLGETGVEKIMNKFDESFDPHLYLEQAGSGYRIYGRTPSMKPVVDFYAENKENVDYKLTELEGFINDAIEKVLNKTGGSGASILVPFSLQTIWERMGGTLTNPAEDQAKFYEEVLSSEQNTWDFAYQTAMLYWGNLKDHPKFKENLDKLGDYAKYIDKIEYVRPNFKYYIVQKDGEIDFIYEGNSELNEAFTSWTLTDRTDFTVAFDEENSKNGGSELYTTLYTDFAYTLPEGTKALKVTAIDETGYATTEEITGVVPAQTPVLLMTKKTDDQTRTLTLAEGGEAVTGNLLVGPDWMIDKYEIKTAQVKSMFDMVHDLLVYEDMENLYGQYVKEYEHLMLRNAGTVNNKYFFGLSADDIAEADVNICQLSQGDLKLAFYHNLEGIEANKAFIPSETVEPVTLTKIGDVNRDGKITIADVTAVVNIILGKVTIENNPNDYDFDAADANTDNSITIADVTAIVNIILGKN